MTTRAFDPLPIITFDPATINESPWLRSTGWRGRVVSVDGLAPETDIPAHDYSADHVDIVVLAWNGDDSESSVGLALLRDGRYIGWSSFIDVTGSGFHEDAYGGDADIFVAMSPVPVLRHLGEHDVETLRFASIEVEHQLASVLWDAWSGGATRAQLCEIARASGEFGDLVEYRIDDLVLHVWKEQGSRVAPRFDEEPA